MLKRNLIANYLGQGWSALMGLAFIPLYIKYLGIEAYGLIGLFAVLQSWLSLFDMGVTPTLSREMARFTGGARSVQSIRDLLRSIEMIVFSIAVAIAIGIWAASGWLASDWLRTGRIPTESVAQAITIMGGVGALRFVEGIYRSSIVGLQRQVLFNILNSLMATLRAIGAIAILAWVSPTIAAFFLWQGAISFLTVCLLAAATYVALPKAGRRGQFSADALRGIGRFAGGMVGIVFLSLLLTQMDKILLSKLLILNDYGYYALASVVAGAVYMLVSPISQAWFPRLSELLARNDQARLVETYHQGAQLVTVVMGSAAMILIVFAETILHIWTQDADLARRTSTLVRLLTLGNMLHSLMWIPYQTQLAHGWTGLAMRINIVGVLIIVPAILLVTPRFGAEGAAWVSVALNASYVLIGIHFMYHKILIGEKWRWYSQDILLPMLGAATAAALCHWLTPSDLTMIGQVSALALSAILTLAAAFSMAPALRQYIQPQILLRLGLRNSRSK